MEDADDDEVLFDLYLEDMVYNFYVQDDQGQWKKYNYDSGAAESVTPSESDAAAFFPRGPAKRQ